MEINITQFDPSSDFTKFKTYDWIPGPQSPTGKPRVDNPLLVSQIRKIVETQLEEQGYQKKETGTPDFWVSYHGGGQN